VSFINEFLKKIKEERIILNSFTDDSFQIFFFYQTLHDSQKLILYKMGKIPLHQNMNGG